MRFSRLSDEEAREMLQAAADPAYREMNRAEEQLAIRLAGATPDERLDHLLAWLELFVGLPALAPSRAIPRTEICLL